MKMTFPTDEDDEGDVIYESDEDYENDEVCRDDEDYEPYDGKECECEGFEREGCGSNLHDIMEQPMHLEHSPEAERTKEVHDIAKLRPEPKHDEPGGGTAFDRGCQQSEHKGELVSPASVSRTF